MRHSYCSLRNSTIFAIPTPELATLAAVTIAYHDAVMETAFNDRRVIYFRNEKRRELETVIADLSNDMEIIAPGERNGYFKHGFSTYRKFFDRRRGEPPSWRAWGGRGAWAR